MNQVIAGIKIPDSKLVRETTELVRDTESDLLFHHSRRVFLFGALAGDRKKLRYDPELLYVGAMFHDMGLTEKYQSSQNRFEVDSANAAADFLRQHGIDEQDIELVWDAISLHTTPGIPPFKKPVVQLVTAGVEMDVLGFAYHDFDDQQREQVIASHPRATNFKEQIIEAFNNGMKHRPLSTFGTVNDDVLALKDIKFQRLNFCGLILGSPWVDDRNGCASCGDPGHHHA
jgi:hypothetical protein